MALICSQLKISGFCLCEHPIPCLFEVEDANSLLCWPLSGVQFQCEKLACSEYGYAYYEVNTDFCAQWIFKL